MTGEHKHDRSWLIFILPLAIVFFIAVSVWVLSLGRTTKAGLNDSSNVTAYVKGSVIKNVIPADKLSGSGYIEILTAQNDVYTVYFDNSLTHCTSDTATQAAAAAPVGAKVVAFGLPVNSRELEVCSSAYFYIRNLGTLAPYENWLLYTDRGAGIEFKYPQNWKLSTSSASVGKLTQFFQASSTEPAIEMTVFTGAESFELAEWASQYYGASAGPPQNTTIANAPAIVVEIKNGDSSKNALLFKHDDKMIQFVFPPSDTKDKNLVALPALILKSIDLINSAAAATTSKSIDSGIFGTVTIGPTCPVQQNPPLEQCKDKPYMAKLRMVDKDHAIVARFSSNELGSFNVAVRPGTYRIENDSEALLPRLSPAEVVVNAHAYTNIPLMFDSGIR